MDDRFETFMRDRLRELGREYERTRRAYTAGKNEADPSPADALPTDEDGRAKLVCRRYAERRAVDIDDGVPACFDPDHTDCVGCVEDIEAGRIEIW